MRLLVSGDGPSEREEREVVVVVEAELPGRLEGIGKREREEGVGKRIWERGTGEQRRGKASTRNIRELIS